MTSRALFGIRWCAEKGVSGKAVRDDVSVNGSQPASPEFSGGVSGRIPVADRPGEAGVAEMDELRRYFSEAARWQIERDCHAKGVVRPGLVEKIKKWFLGLLNKKPLGNQNASHKHSPHMDGKPQVQRGESVFMAALNAPNEHLKERVGRHRMSLPNAKDQTP